MNKILNMESHKRKGNTGKITRKKDWIWSRIKNICLV